MIWGAKRWTNNWNILGSAEEIVLMKSITESWILNDGKHCMYVHSYSNKRRIRIEQVFGGKINYCAVCVTQTSHLSSNFIWKPQHFLTGLLLVSKLKHGTLRRLLWLQNKFWRKMFSILICFHWSCNNRNPIVFNCD